MMLFRVSVCRVPLMRMFFMRQLLTVLIGLIALCLPPAHAQPKPPQKLKVGYLRTDVMLPLFLAQEKGYFTAQGLDVELITLNNGPAVASAVQNGGLDIGYAAPIPIIAARSQGQHFQFFAATGHDNTDVPVIVFLAAQRSNILSFKDLAGKTIAVNAANSGCELAAKEHAAAAGVAWNRIKTLIIPFPQMQAALELGSADAVCTAEPFTASTLASKKIGAVVIAEGFLANRKNQQAMTSGFFARDGWLQGNAQAASAFTAAMERSMRDLRDDPQLGQQLMVSTMRFKPDIAKTIGYVPVPDMSVRQEHLTPMMAAMVRHGIIPTQPENMHVTLPARH